MISMEDEELFKRNMTLKNAFDVLSNSYHLLYTYNRTLEQKIIIFLSKNAENLLYFVPNISPIDSEESNIIKIIESIGCNMRMAKFIYFQYVNREGKHD